VVIIPAVTHLALQMRPSRGFQVLMQSPVDLREQDVPDVVSEARHGILASVRDVI
jgi:hypothetical protein